MNEAEIRERLEAAKLGHLYPRLEPHLRPTVDFRLERAEEARIRVGTSKMGGVPDLPPGFSWPTETLRSVGLKKLFGAMPQKSAPMSFIAQVNLPEVSPYDAEEVLPATGMLYFFYTASHYFSGYRPESNEDFKVLYAEESRHLVRSHFPDDLPKKGRFAPCIMTAARGLTPPDLENEVFESWDEKELDLFKVFPEDGINQMLGHAAAIQGEMEWQLDDESKGLETGTGPWKLLLQVDSNPECHMMWGDAGRLYYWIREDDLKARRFQRVWMTWQGY